MEDRSRPAADDVRAVRFREAFRGYDPRGVDQLLERVSRDLDAGRPLGWVAAERGFKRCFRGYDMAEVDRFLGRLLDSDRPGDERTSADRAGPTDDAAS